MYRVGQKSKPQTLVHIDVYSSLMPAPYLVYVVFGCDKACVQKLVLCVHIVRIVL